MQHFFLYAELFAQSHISVQTVLLWAVMRGLGKKNLTQVKDGTKAFFTRSSALFSTFSCLLSGLCCPAGSWPSPTTIQRTIPAHEARNLLSPAYAIPTCPAPLQNGGWDPTHSVPQDQPAKTFCSFHWARPVLSGLIPSLITSDSFAFGLFPEEEMGG